MSGGADRERARAALQSRGLLGAVVSAVLGGAVITALGLLAVHLLELAIPPPAVGVVGLALGVALELVARRQDVARLAPGLALLDEVLRLLPPDDGRPEAGRVRGLPWIRGVWREVAFAMHLEPERPRGLRVAVTVEGETPEPLWVAARLPEGFPQGWLDRLKAKHRHHPIDGLGEALVAVSPRPHAAGALLAPPGVQARARALLELNAPVAAVIDMGGGQIGWDTRVTRGLRGATLLEVVEGLAGLLERPLDGDPAEEPGE